MNLETNKIKVEDSDALRVMVCDHPQFVPEGYSRRVLTDSDTLEDTVHWVNSDGTDYNPTVWADDAFDLLELAGVTDFRFDSLPNPDMSLGDAFCIAACVLVLRNIGIEVDYASL